MILRELISKLVVDFNSAPVLNANRMLDKTKVKMTKAEGAAVGLSRKSKTAFRDVSASSGVMSAKVRTNLVAMGSGFRRFGARAVASAATVGASVDKLTTRIERNRGALLGIGIAAGAAIAFPIKEALEFQTAISKLEAIGGVTGKALKDLSDEASRLGRTTVFTATQVASAQVELAKAGFSQQEILGALPGILDAAVASEEDLGVVSDKLTGILRGMGLAAGDAGHVADVLTVAANSTKASIGGLGEALKFAAPPAKQLGVSFEGLTAVAALMADAGIDNSTVGTSLRQGFLQLSKQTKATKEALSSMGVKVFDLNGKLKPLPEVVSLLSKGTAGMTSQQRLSTLATIFGARAVSGWAAVLDRGVESVVKLKGALNDSTGAANKTATIMQDNLGGSFLRLSSATQGLAKEFGQPFLSPLQGIIDTTARAANKFTDFLISLGPLGKGLSLLTGGVVTLVGSTALLALALPPVVKGFKFLGKSASKSWDILKRGGSAILNVSSKLKRLVVSLFRSRAASTAFATSSKLIKGAMLGVRGAIAKSILAIKGFRLQLLISKAAALFSGAMSAMGAGLAALRVAFISSSLAATGFTVALLANPLVQLGLAVVGVSTAVFLLAKNFDKVKKVGSDAWKLIKGVWRGAVGFFGGVGSKIGRLLGNLFHPPDGFGKALFDLLTAPLKAVLRWLGINFNLGKVIGNLIDKGKSFVTSAISNIAKSIWDFIPHNSPAKVGPLSKLDKFGPAFGGELKKNILGTKSTITKAMANVLKPDRLAFNIPAAPKGLPSKLNIPATLKGLPAKIGVSAVLRGLPARVNVSAAFKGLPNTLESAAALRSPVAQRQQQDAATTSSKRARASISGPFINNYKIVVESPKGGQPVDQKSADDLASRILSAIKAKESDFQALIAPFVSEEIVQIANINREHLPLDRPGFGMPAPATR